MYCLPCDYEEEVLATFWPGLLSMYYQAATAILAGFVEDPSLLSFFSQVSEDWVPWLDQVPPYLHHLWVLLLGGWEGHHPGQALDKQVQGGSPVWTLGTMEQDRIMFLTNMLGHRSISLSRFIMWAVWNIYWIGLDLKLFLKYIYQFIAY